MRKSYAAALLLIVIAAISAPAAAQGITGPTQSFYNDGPLSFVDSLTVTDINNGQDFLVFVIIPLIGVYGLMWFMFSKVLQMAENNFADNDNPTSDDLSEMGQKAAQLMAFAVAVVTVMRYGNFSPAIVALLFILGLLMLLRNMFGFNLPGLPNIGGGGGGPNVPDSIDVNAPDSIDVNAPDSIPVDGPGGSDDDDSTSPTSPPGGGGPGGVNQNMTLKDLVNIDMDSSQELAAMMQQAQQQMQQQQQMQMTPGMMQMMALFQGRMAPGNGGVVIQPPNGPNVTVQQQQINQLMQMMMQVLSEGDGDFDMNVMMQMMQVVVNNGGDLNGNLIQVLEQYFQKVENNPKIVQINNVEIEKVVNQQYYDISNVLVSRLNQTIQQKNISIDVIAFKQFLSLLELNFMANSGDTVIIHVEDGQDVEIDVSIIVQFISVIENLPSSIIGPIVQKIINVFIEVDGPLTGDLLVQITNIIVNIEEGESPEGVGPDGVDITIEDLELVTVDGHQPFPRVQKDNGYVHVLPAGASTEQIGIRAMVSSNARDGLQHIMFGFDGNQLDQDLNSSSYGHDQGDVVPLSQIVGDHKFQEGQMHNLSIQVTGQMGDTENATMQAEVWAPVDTPEETPEVPALEPGPDMPPLPEGDDLDVDPGKLISEIEDIIGDLDGELDIEESAFEEKRDAEQKLVEALKELQNYNEFLRVLIYFREVDFSAPHAEVHQQVEKILSNINEIGSASQLQKELKNIQQIFGKVENALKELQEAYDKISSGAQRQQQDVPELDDIEETVQKLSNGAGNIKNYLDNYYNN